MMPTPAEIILPSFVKVEEKDKKKKLAKEQERAEAKLKQKGQVAFSLEGMMAGAREKVVQILNNQPDKKMEVYELSLELSREHALGFGVTATDVIDALDSRGTVGYDRDNDTVWLLEK
jgi:hypothetical protein